MEKPLQIVFKGMDASESLEALIRERVARLGRFHSRITGCRVVVDVPHRSQSGKTPIGIAVEVDVPGRHTIVAKDSEDRREMKNDHNGFINRTFDAVQRQLEDAADIRKHEVKHHESAGETGVVVRFFPEQDYGFIEIPGSADLYFTRNAVAGGGFDQIKPGTMVYVTRATTEGPMGPQASSVRLLEAQQSPA